MGHEKGGAWGPRAPLGTGVMEASWGGPYGAARGSRLTRVFPPQSEERKRIDELIESGKEEGMKVRAAGPVRRGRTRQGHRGFGLSVTTGQADCGVVVGPSAETLVQTPSREGDRGAASGNCCPKGTFLSCVQVHAAQKLGCEPRHSLRRRAVQAPPAHFHSPRPCGRAPGPPPPPRTHALPAVSAGGLFRTLRTQAAPSNKQLLYLASFTQYDAWGCFSKEKRISFPQTRFFCEGAVPRKYTFVLINFKGVWADEKGGVLGAGRVWVGVRSESPGLCLPVLVRLGRAEPESGPRRSAFPCVCNRVRRSPGG